MIEIKDREVKANVEIRIYDKEKRKMRTISAYVEGIDIDEIREYIKKKLMEWGR